MTSPEWKSLLAEEPDNELIHFSYAKALFDESQWTEAAKEFRALLKVKADYAIAWAFLAKSLLRAGDEAGARQACAEGLPIALQQKHEIPEEEIRAVLEELDSEF